MSIFTEVKEHVTAREVAEFYGLKVNRKGLACCPFHDDKHPSMKIDQFYYCFACGEKGDAINYVSRLYGLSPYESVRKIADDFHLILNNDGKQDEAIRRRQLEKAKVAEAKRKHIIQIQKQFRDWCNRKIEELKVCLDIIETASNYLQGKPPEEVLESNDVAVLMHSGALINY